MAEPELTPELAAQLVGVEPKSQAEPSEGDEAERPGDPDRDQAAHDTASAEATDGHPEQQADEQFFRMLHPPPDEGDE